MRTSLDDFLERHLFALRVALILLVVAVLLFLLIDASKCRQFEARTQRVFNEIMTRGKVHADVKLEFEYVGLAPAYATADNVIWVSKWYFRNYSDEALKGLLGHELGHIQAGHFAHERSFEQEAVDQRQVEATAIGICLVGTAAMEACFDGWEGVAQHLALAKQIKVNSNTCKLE